MIAIIDYNAGNVRSVRRACTHIGITAELTADPEVIRAAEKIIFPGVGRAGSAMASLRQSGLDKTLKEVFAMGKPMLVICVGAQLILDYSEEDDTQCLGLIPGVARRFQLDDPALKIPHMGWNAVQPEVSHPLFESGTTAAAAGNEYYFAHAYYPAPANDSHCYASSDHGGRFCSALGQDNLFATQFHPEKSGPVGLRLLAAFMQWDGSYVK